jgi:hypothetical protein
MVRCVILFAAILFIAATSSTVRADDWIYHGSAYSHSPRWGREVGPNRFTRGPYYSPQSGGFYRGGYRNTYGGGWSGGWGGGWNYDNHAESWWQTGSMWTY